MKRTISNPYKVNHKIYIRLVFLFLITLYISFLIPTKENNCLATCADIIRNLSYGCIGSTVVAWLIECKDIKNANSKANKIYDAAYGDLKHYIGSFIALWAQLCAVAFKEENYYEHKDIWENWYKTTKLNFYKSDAKRQEELLVFFRKQLSDYADSVNKSLEYVQSQRYMLTVNDVMNKDMERILSDFRFEFYALDIDLSHEETPDLFWEHMDAITSDLINYINNWADIRYFNSLKFSPYKFISNTDDLRDAILLSELIHIFTRKNQSKQK